MHQAGHGCPPKATLILRTLEQKNHPDNHQGPHGALRSGVHATKRWRFRSWGGFNRFLRRLSPKK